ncbi:chromosome segregation ATPase [Bradyrhizobium sp. USDA 326]|uniref:hypothetical protein n=1 Tax=unclassified Bradyrhizobium TaxID=2631580 RepID=UPI003516C989
MTLEEALQKVAELKPRQQHKYEEVRSAFLLARDQKRLMGSTARVTHEEVRQLCKGRSTGTVAKYLLLVETIETANGDDDESHRPEQASSVNNPLAAIVNKALDNLHAAVAALPSAIAESDDALSKEIADRFQALLDHQTAKSEIALAEKDARIADLESASYDSGDEAEESQSQVDDLTAALASAKTERDAAIVQADEIRQTLELDRTRLSSALEQIQALKTAETTLSAELSQLRDERKTLLADAARAAELEAELTVLTNHAANLEQDVKRLQVITNEAEDRHQREHEALRATYNHDLELERQRNSKREAEFFRLLARAVDRESETQESLS